MKDKQIFIYITPLLLAAMLSFFRIDSIAASSTTSSLPYSPNNDYFMENFYNGINEQLPEGYKLDKQGSFVYFSDVNYGRFDNDFIFYAFVPLDSAGVVFTSTPNDFNYDNYNPIINSEIYDNDILYQYGFRYNLVNYKCYEVYLNWNSLHSSGIYDRSDLNYLYNRVLFPIPLNSIVNINGFDFVYNAPIYINGSIDYNSKPLVSSGEDNKNHLNFTITDLTTFPDTQPDFDTPTDSFTWWQKIYNRLGGLIQQTINNGKNIVDNIKSFFSPVLSYIASAIDSISQQMSNIIDILSNIPNFFEYMTKPVNTDVILSELEQTPIYILTNEINFAFRTVYNALIATEAVDRLSFSIPYTIGSITGYLVFNFDWYATIKSQFLTCLLTFLYIGFCVYFARALPSLIGGLSSINKTISH